MASKPSTSEPDVKGLDASVATERLLDLLGHAYARSELRFLRDGDGSAEDVREELRHRGLIVRVVSTGTDSFDARLPSLAQLQGGEGWLVIRSRRRRSLLVESREGLLLVPDQELSKRLSGVALEITPSLALPGRLWKVMIASAQLHSKRLAAILVATLVVQLLSLLPPQFTRLALDQALPQGAGSLLNAITLGLVLAGAFQAWTAWLRQRALLFLRVQMQLVVERGFFDHVLRLPFTALRGRTVGDFMQAMFGLAEARGLATERAAGIFLDGMMSAAYLVIMAVSMPAPTIAIAMAGATMAAISVLVGRLQARLQRAEVEAQIKQRAFLIEGLSGIATIKGMGAERPVLRAWVELLLTQFASSLRRQRVGLFAGTFLDGIRQALSLLVMTWAGYLVLEGRATLGTFTAFMQMSGGFLNGVLSAANGIVDVLVLRPQLTKTAELAGLALPRACRSAGTTCAGPIVVEDLSFRYAPEAPWVLSGYELRVETGDKHWVKAPSGWGKSTLLRLLAGVYSPERGTVRIGDRDPATTRGLVLLLPQFVHLYAGSIYDNLRILSAHAPRNRILEAAEASGLADLAKTLTMGYDTALPPGGSTLSGGQRQLIAVTAAMASTRSVLLLDEAFANIDALASSGLITSPWFENRTVIYASHDTHFAPA